MALQEPLPRQGRIILAIRVASRLNRRPDAPGPTRPTKVSLDGVARLVFGPTRARVDNWGSYMV